MTVEQSVEWLSGETEVLREDLSQCRFVHQKSYMTLPGSIPGRRAGKPATNRLSYITASFLSYSLTLFTDWLTDSYPVVLAASRQITVPLVQCNCCLGKMLVCRAVTYHLLLYSCLFHSRCLAMPQYLYILFSLHLSAIHLNDNGVCKFNHSLELLILSSISNFSKFQ
jgi:hypothetical protein